MKVHVKKNDQVVVISGPETIKGKQGKVLTVLPQDNKVIVEGVAYVSKHQKSRRQASPAASTRRSARWMRPTSCSSAPSAARLRASARKTWKSKPTRAARKRRVCAYASAAARKLSKEVRRKWQHA